MSDHALAVWGFRLGIIGVVLGVLGFGVAILAWWSSNQTAKKATRTLGNIARGLEDLSHGHAVLFQQDGEGNIIARTVEITLGGIPSGEQVLAPTVGLCPPPDAPVTKPSDASTAASPRLSLAASIDKQVIRAPQPSQPPDTPPTSGP
jgi:hypothetical protein